MESAPSTIRSLLDDVHNGSEGRRLVSDTLNRAQRRLDPVRDALPTCVIHNDANDYNVLVARRARQELGWDTLKLEESQRDRLQRWVEMVKSRHGELRSWADDLPAFWELLHRYRIGQSTRDFISGIVRSAVDNPEGFGEDPTIHEQIRLREVRLKGRRARLVHRAALENWNQTAGGGQLGYRWSIAKNYLGELAEAMGRDP